MKKGNEISHFIAELNNTIDLDNPDVLNRIVDDKDFTYFQDVLKTLSWALLKISRASTDKERDEVETELRELEKKTMTYLCEESGEEERNRFSEYINKEFGRDCEIGNISDTIDWIIERTTTEEFKSNNYLDLESLRKKAKGEEKNGDEK